MALAEDAPFGDLTSETLVPVGAVARGAIVAREPGVMAGGDVLTASFVLLDPTTEVSLLVADGDPFVAGDVLARVVGPGRSVLRSERVALNLVQRMCGIATLTRRHVDAVAAVPGSRARVVDTRKTTPGLRALERHAVRCGGGHNHRFSLSDAVLAKDNHLALVGDDPGALTAALREARAALPHTVHLEVEVDRPDQIEPVLAAGVDTIMLDNFDRDALRAGVDQVAGRALVEASGGVTLETIADIAATGVDVISVGALTHSVRALDLGLDLEMS
ncbi:carboxylating nicotinate-nucleotide diphosphorylase [Janibacter sp. G56]|uniref:carboxylating nicotinate-nucleotide diphosphorylase n=1 Tax=Janibacter sp. G56 TaxID=3418717 RepID=UPI003CFC3EE3